VANKTSKLIKLIQKTHRSTKLGNLINYVIKRIAEKVICWKKFDQQISDTVTGRREVSTRHRKQTSGICHIYIFI